MTTAAAATPQQDEKKPTLALELNVEDKYMYHLVLGSYLLRKFVTHCPGCEMEGM